MTRLLALVVAIAVVLVAAGCGKGRLSKEDFVAKANAVCRAYEEDQNAVQFPTVNPIDPKSTHAQRAEWGLALKRIVDIGDNEIKGLGKLNPPTDLEDRYEDLLAAWQRANDTLREASVAAKKNDPATLKKKGAEARTQLAQVASQAKALGLSGCG